MNGAVPEGGRRSGRGFVRGLFRFIRLSFGFSVLIIAAFWIGVGDAGMATVSLVRTGLVYTSSGSGGPWALTPVLIAVGMAACTTPNAPSGSATTRIDFVQLAAALSFVCLTLMFLPFVSGMEFTAPDDQCVYGNCWPQPYQELLLAAPALMAAVSMSVCAIIGTRTRWWLRALIPAAAVIGASALQFATWQPLILPILGGPPPH